MPNAWKRRSPSARAQADVRLAAVIMAMHHELHERYGSRRLWRELRRRGILGSAELAAQPHGARVRVAGLLVVHQSPPTAKGFHFLTLEDEDGMMNVIVRPAVYDRHRRVIHGELLLLTDGKVQCEGNVVNLLAEHIYPLAQLA